jgi:hypothetical protein
MPSDIQKRVTAIQGIPVSSAAPTVGQVLQFNGTEYVPVNIVSYFTPKSISGLQVWLAADIGVIQSSGNVSEWDDQSGNGNNVYQTLGANQPTYNTTGGPNNAPYLSFSATNNQYLENITVNPIIYNSTTVFSVHNVTITTGDPAPWSYGNQNGVQCFVQDATGFRTVDFYTISSASAGTYTSVTWENWALTSSNFPLQTFYVNGISTTLSANNNTGITASGGFFIGSSGETAPGSPVLPMNGGIAEHISYNRVLSLGEIAAVGTYLSSKYAL